ncbi:MAG: NUDIX hydrolase [Gammaproteobacteria bacterium]|nr:NUDIX hydrolase [Gammaproteobacteria bacterium]MBU2679536.1 NUDIX hydrolase [Gammaproteobacteria bacterium]
MRLSYIGFLVFALAACSSPGAPPAGLIAYSCVAGEALHLMAFDPHPSRRAWATLGGGAKQGETPEQTAIREFTEESNCAYTAEELQAGELKGPSISPGVPFHLYTTEVSFKPVDVIAQTRQCVDIERSQWVWVRHLDLVRALNQFDGSADAAVTVPTVQGQPLQVPLWNRGVESLKKALQDGVLPETINCDLTRLS